MTGDGSIRGSLIELLRLRAGVYSVEDAAGQLHLVAPFGSQCLGSVPASVAGMLTELAERDWEEVELLSDDGGKSRGGDRRDLLDRLREGGWLQTSVSQRQSVSYTVIPVGPPSAAFGGSLAQEKPVLSRFALLHRRPEGVVLESPCATADFLFRDHEALCLVVSLMEDVEHRQAFGTDPPLYSRLLADLATTGFLASVEESEGFNHRKWAPHDLWMHSRSRVGRQHDWVEGFGGTWWARGKFPPLPARPATHNGPIHKLERPDLSAIQLSDPPLSSVLESRRSIREHNDDSPISVEALGEFLFRCARVRRVSQHDGIEYVDRIAPAGGSFGELELYPAVWNVDGLEPGLYHYDAHEHQLDQVRVGSGSVRRIITLARKSTGMTGHPQAVLVVSARFGRIMWKYEDMAYALILKHVGVLYQTMYLVATAMGLAPCAIGVGDSRSFSEMAQLDYLAESSVGEFMLGSRVLDSERDR